MTYSYIYLTILKSFFNCSLRFFYECLNNFVYNYDFNRPFSKNFQIQIFMKTIDLGIYLKKHILSLIKN